MTRSVATERGTDRRRRDALENQFANHAHKARMGSGGAAALVGDSKFLATLASLCIEIEDDLDVIGDESNRDQHKVFCAAGMLLVDYLQDVRTEPGLRGGTATALVHEALVWVRERIGHKARGLLQLFDIA